MADNIYIYHTSPNQKSIITKKTVSGSNAPYGICNVSAVLTAAQTLSDRAFKLYVRMNLHQDGHTYALSPVEIMKSVGMSDKRYREAVKELIDKGYLVQSDKHKALYMFYEYPQLDNHQNTELPVSPDNPTEMGTSYTQNGKTTRPFGTDNPSISGGEILHNITSHNTSNSTVDNKNMNISPKEKVTAPIDLILEEQRKKLEKEEKKRQTLAWGMHLYDEDDVVMYAEPEANDSISDLDDYELPF